MEIKAGVIMPRRVEIYAALIAAEKIWREHGRAEGVTVTSGREGRHSVGSKHYADDAFDFRVRYFTEAEKQSAAVALKKALGADFDVILEEDHIHAEYHPKGRPWPQPISA